jgi:hypothetical protein
MTALLITNRKVAPTGVEQLQAHRTKPAAAPEFAQPV